MNIIKHWIGIGHALIALFIMITTTFLGSVPVLLIGLLKLYPNDPWKKKCTHILDHIAILWSDVNNAYINHIHPAHWDVIGPVNYNPKDWYLVVANHQSWLDIVVLQRIFNRKIPVLKFFIKDQLKWVPILGFSWWAMGCPFMKRYSPAYLDKHPEKKGADLEATKKALKSFKQAPGTLMSFVEGTRFTKKKSLDQNAPYQHLLKPKAGGVGFVIDIMNKQIKHLLDVTIVYPNKENSLWQFLCRRIHSVKIHIRELPIPQHFLNSDLLENETMLYEFRQWLNLQWSLKDQLITSMKT
ncbi:MAG: acyltransferase [Legionellales bacterium]|nr:acyltransferase [Legionellales bacterium]